jgi:hypothetical protein
MGQAPSVIASQVFAPRVDHLVASSAHQFALQILKTMGSNPPHVAEQAIRLLEFVAMIGTYNKPQLAETMVNMPNKSFLRFRLSSYCGPAVNLTHSQMQTASHSRGSARRGKSRWSTTAQSTPACCVYASGPSPPSKEPE